MIPNHSRPMDSSSALALSFSTPVHTHPRSIGGLSVCDSYEGYERASLASGE